MREALREFRTAFRSLRSQPGLAGIAILALGLGIGFTTVMFSIVHGALYRGLPVPEGDRVHTVLGVMPARNIQQTDIPVADFLDLQAQQESMEELAAFSQGTLNLSGDGGPERFDGGFMSANAFRVLGVQPLLGRDFLPGEDLPGAERVVILGYALWQNRFGGDRDVLGRGVRVNGEPATIVGVMPSGFLFPESQALWTNITLDATAAPRGQGQFVTGYGKLRVGVTLDQARAEFSRVGQRLAEAYPATNEDLRFRVDLYTKMFVGEDTEPLLLSMLMVVVLVLVAACVNVANLLLARAAGRTKELAIRTSLGASRGRILGHLLAEASVLAFFGALLGISIAYVGIELFDRAVVDTRPPYWFVFALDGPILIFVLAMTALSALVSGVIPGMKASGARANEFLKDASRGSSSFRIGRLARLLVMAEVTMSVGLLVTASHLGKALYELKTTEFGFEREVVLTARLGLFETDIPEVEGRQAFHRDLLSALQARPEIRHASITDRLPGLRAPETPVALQGESYPEERDLPRVRLATVSPGFFETFDTERVEGRDFSAADDANAPPVALVNRSFARRYLRDRDPLGAQLRLSLAEEAPWITVVGVAPDLYMEGAGELNPDPEGIYLPLAQQDLRFVSLAVRGGGTPQALAEPLREEVTRLNSDTPIYWVRTMKEALDQELWSADVFGGLFIIFGLGALFLAAVGLYGVMSFSVKRRTQEMGIRMALGAGSGKVMGMVLKAGVLQTLGGLVLGLGLGGLLAMAFQGSIPMDPWDPRVFLGISGVLMATALLATFVPAMRATRVDPVAALRDG